MHWINMQTLKCVEPSVVIQTFQSHTTTQADWGERMVKGHWHSGRGNGICVANLAVLMYVLKLAVSYF